MTKSKVWKHRGGSPDNSILGVKKAISTEGFEGVEIDLFFDLENNVFLVTHDKPIKGGEYITLEQFLLELKVNKVSFWLDLKNLSNQNADNIIKKIKLLEYKYPSFKNFIIESQEYFPLRKLSYKGIDSVYWINPHTKSRLRFFRNLINKWRIISSDFVGVSAYYSHFESSILKDSLLRKIPVYLFTINEKNTLEKLLLRENVKVILSKSIGPI
jgi:hypothetical protein